MTVPDFASQIYFEDYAVYATRGQPGRYWVSPRRLALAPGADGMPDLHLSLVRATLPQPRSYGLLELGVQAEYPLAEAAVQIGAGKVPVSICPALPTTGHLRLALGQSVISQPLTWNGLTKTRLRMRLTADEAALVRQALEQGTLIVQATVALAISGNAALADMSATFDPHALLGALAAARDTTGYAPYPALQAFLTEGWERLPLRWQHVQEATVAPQEEAMRAALLDRIVAHFAMLASPPTDDPTPYIALPEDVSHGEITWQLDDACIAWRPIVLQWHPLEVVHEHIATHGLAPFMTATTTPPLPTGTVEVEVVGNLPANRSNVLSLGAYLSMPPSPPVRLHSVQATATLLEPRDAATVTLRLGAKESLNCVVRPFIVLATAGNFLSFEGTPRTSRDASVELSVTDFPVSFYPLTAEANLLALARLTGELRWQDSAGQHHIQVMLDGDHLTMTVAIPSDAVAPMLHLTAEALADGRTLALPPLALEETYLTLWHLPGFGAHTLRFSMATASAPADRTIEVQVEDAQETAQLTLRNDHPAQEWGYVALDPFHPGFRYRLLGYGEWSPWLSPLDHTEVTL